MNFLNFTPHVITVYSGDDKTIIDMFPSNGVARVTQYETLDTIIQLNGHNVELTKTNIGSVVGLPDEKEGTLIIVSSIVRQALPERNDLISPSNFVRNSISKQVIGCRNFTR